MDDVFERNGNPWVSHCGGGGGGICWSTLGDGPEGVLRFADEAPEGTARARILYEGHEHLVPVRHGHFLLAAWGTDFMKTHPYWASSNRVTIPEL